MPSRQVLAWERKKDGDMYCVTLRLTMVLEAQPAWKADWLQSEYESSALQVECRLSARKLSQVFVLDTNDASKTRMVALNSELAQRQANGGVSLIKGICSIQCEILVHKDSFVEIIDLWRGGKQPPAQKAASKLKAELT